MLMMQNDFVAASANLNEPDSVAAELPLVRETKHQAVNTALSNSFGFGGTNGTLIFKKI